MVDLLCVFVCVSLQVGLANFCFIMALHGCGISSPATRMHWIHVVVPAEIAQLLERFESSIRMYLNVFHLIKCIQIDDIFANTSAGESLLSQPKFAAVAYFCSFSMLFLRLRWGLQTSEDQTKWAEKYIEIHFGR